MKRILLSGLALSLVLGATAASAAPQYNDHRGDSRSDQGDRRGDQGEHRGDRGDDRNGRGGPPGHQWDHRNWHKGGRVDRDEWRHGQRIDYRMHHLRRPPRGYEWRQVNGDYVLGAIATGLIVDLLINNH